MPQIRVSSWVIQIGKTPNKYEEEDKHQITSDLGLHSIKALLS